MNSPSSWLLLGWLVATIVVPTVASTLHSELLRASEDPSVFAVSGFGTNDSELLAFGVKRLDSRDTNTVNTCFRMQALSELLVALCAIRMLLPFTLVDVIPSRFLPRGVELRHPTSLEAVSLLQLLTHTSSLADPSSVGTSRARSPTDVGSLQNFLETSLLEVRGGRYRLREGVFFSERPGCCIRYAAINTAVAAFVLEGVARTDPVSYPDAAFSALLRRLVLDPLMMHSTFRLSSTGYHSGIVDRVWDHDVNGSPLDYITIHPAYPAKWMYYTTISDVRRLLDGIFFAGPLADAGDRLLTLQLDVNGSLAVPGFSLVEASIAEQTSFDGFGEVGLRCHLAPSRTCWFMSVSYFGRTMLNESVVQRLLRVAGAASNAPVVNTNAPAEHSTSLLALWVVIGVALAIVVVVGATWMVTTLVLQPQIRRPDPPRIPVVELPQWTRRTRSDEPYGYG